MGVVELQLRLRPDQGAEEATLSGQEVYRRFIPIPAGFFPALDPAKLSVLRLSGLKILDGDVTVRVELTLLLKAARQLSELSLDNVGLSWIEAQHIPTATLCVFSLTELKETPGEAEALFQELFLNGRPWPQLVDLRFIAWPEPANFSFSKLMAAAPGLTRLDLRWMMVEPDTLAGYPLSGLALQSRDFQLSALALSGAPLRYLPPLPLREASQCDRGLQAEPAIAEAELRGRDAAGTPGPGRLPEPREAPPGAAGGVGESTGPGPVPPGHPRHPLPPLPPGPRPPPPLALRGQPLRRGPPPTRRRPPPALRLLLPGKEHSNPTLPNAIATQR